MLAQRQLDAAEQLAQRTAHKAKQLEFRHTLLDQMAIKARLKQRRYEEFLREKRDIDAIVARFYEESVRDLAEQQQRKQRFRDDLLVLRQQHDAWTARQRRELDEESARIERYLVERDAKEEAQRQAVVERRQAGSDLAERLGAVQVQAEVSFSFCWLWFGLLHSFTHRIVTHKKPVHLDIKTTVLLCIDRG